MGIYCHSTVITKVMLLYNTESWYGHEMAVNYCGKKSYNVGPRVPGLIQDAGVFQDPLLSTTSSVKELVSGRASVWEQSYITSWVIW